MEQRAKSVISWMRFDPLFVHLLGGRDCSLNGTQRTVSSLRRWTSLSVWYHFDAPVGGLLPNTEKLYLLKCEPIRKGLLRNPCLPYRWATPLRILNRNRVSLYARATILVLHFSFLYYAEKKHSLQLLSHIFEVISIRFQTGMTRW